MSQTLEFETPYGPARGSLLPAERPAGALILGHGAGGGIGAADLVAAAAAASEAGFSTVLVEQPYRVAGRRNQPAAKQLDAAWLAVVKRLRAEELRDLPLVVGGRSAGARVACRTATDAGAIAVLCLAFPLHAPGRRDDPSKSRLPELEAVTVPVLVVQGDRDPFGMPPAAANRTVIAVPGTHSLRDGSAIGAPVSDWLQTLTSAAAAPRAAGRGGAPGA